MLHSNLLMYINNVSNFMILYFSYRTDIILRLPLLYLFVLVLTKNKTNCWNTIKSGKLKIGLLIWMKRIPAKCCTICWLPNLILTNKSTWWAEVTNVEKTRLTKRDQNKHTYIHIYVSMCVCRQTLSHFMVVRTAVLLHLK